MVVGQTRGRHGLQEPFPSKELSLAGVIPMEHFPQLRPFIPLINLCRALTREVPASRTLQCVQGTVRSASKGQYRQWHPDEGASQELWEGRDPKAVPKDP